MNILVVRFRQMGDAILATALLNTLRDNFPDARIDFVLNERLAPLFHGHPAISNVITFTETERHSFTTYIAKVWRIVHTVRYDVIIDMRSTMNTMVFALLSPRTKFRIGRKKWYTTLAFNHAIPSNNTGLSMVDIDLAFAEPLNAIRKMIPNRQFTLCISDKERDDFGRYLEEQGMDLKQPILLVNVTAKLAKKVWNEEKMVWVLTQFLNTFPNWQLVFNYAPGEEEKNARRIYERLGSPKQVYIDVQAHSPRELMAMGGFVTCFFGNEGGARHIIHAAGCPSLVVCAPENSKTVWIPQNDVPAMGIAPSDFASCEKLAGMSREEQYELIDQEYVWNELREFVNSL